MGFFDKNFQAAFEDKDDRLYGYYADAHALILTMVAFQVWDFVVTLITPQLCMLQHIVHHSLTCLLAFLGLYLGRNGFLLYYGVFFFGRLGDLVSPTCICGPIQNE